CLVGRPTIFVPSPMVAEDHQTHNAMALVNKGAAIMVRDDEAVEKLFDEAEKLLFNREKLEQMRDNLLKLGTRNASETIAKEILNVL
ncbi:MAG: UDP-N-acetylglucosamine--N-acetylmuramyl-(pentapeptide) pyrophosphoryl-undecaprenol N-acetylglucosamine transferase, partial [Bacteroidales bacterium]|nr:UDP-N-acetylglucosamine--N-acetylmuramyl-(pentapeptide) pyrophosphoryl-undecaprenol N-acetylglucosamine transferase [Bacteroidales bacterium]